MYSRETIEALRPFLSHHFNLTVELPLKAIVRGYSYAVLPNSWRNRTAGEAKLKIKEMGSHEELLQSGGFYSKLHEMQFEKHPAKV